MTTHAQEKSTLLERSRALAIDCIAFKNAYMKIRSTKASHSQHHTSYIEALEPSHQTILKKRQRHFEVQLTTA